MKPGYGTIANPETLSDILRDCRVQPGHNIYLREGVYSGNFISSLNGLYNNLITIKPYNNERVIIDGSLTLNGSYCLLEDVEITYYGWLNRSTDTRGSSPTDIPHNTGLIINSSYSEIRHCVISDVASLSVWEDAKQVKIYGNVVFNIGWNSTLDRGHGHLFYTQNDSIYGRKLFKHNVATSSFATGLKIYTENGKASGYDIVGNTVYNSACLYGGNDYGMNFWVQDPSGHDYKFQNNKGYHKLITGNSVQMGLYNAISNLELIDNYFSEGIFKYDGDEIITESGNYYGPEIGNKVFVEPDDYDTGRGIITIYNQNISDNIVVDLTSIIGLSIGDNVILINTQDWFNDRAIKTLDADKKITISMINRTVSTPIKWVAPDTTFPLFGCFVVKKA